MTTTHETAAEQMYALTALTVAATEAEMRAAAYVIARQVRDLHPTADRVHLEASDQGDWLSLARWSDPSGRSGDLHDAEEAEDAATHLYLPQIASTPDGGAVPGLWQTERRPARYVLEIEEVLDGYATPVVVEVLTVRDPDGPTAVHHTVLGTVPPHWAVSEFSVDAGAGHEWEDWAAHRDECLTSASEALRPALLDALADPPGGKYIEGRDGRPWLDGSPHAAPETR